jgi:GTPase-associated protein 1, N-terminal domain type 1/Effector-associated domain 1
MRIETAIYGEVKGGHALRAASADPQFARNIAPKLDLPSNPPPGVQWPPYISGFAEGHFYILARTFPDPTASRSGMVRSHALIARTSDLVRCRNVSSLLIRLGSSLDDSFPVDGFNFVEDKSAPVVAEDLVATANALTEHGKFPVVRLGVEGFETLIASLWANLWPEIRAGFFFRASFGPNDVVEERPPLIVSTPASLTARWSGYRVINGSQAAVNSRPAAVVAGVDDSAPLLSFGHDIGADLAKLPNLVLIDRARELLAGGDNVDDLIAAARLVDGLSPDISLGVEAKQDLATRLASKIRTAAAQNILFIRNLSLAGFPSVPALWTAVERWVQEAAFDVGQDQAFLSMLAATNSETETVPAWRTAIVHGMRAAAHNARPALITAIWRWIEKSNEAIAPLFKLFPETKEFDRRLANAAPRTIPQAQANEMIHLSSKQAWLSVHGAVLSASQKPIVAIKRQIALDTDITNANGVKLALRFASPSEKLESACELHDPRVVDLAAEAVVAEPRIFQAARCSDIGEQMVWEALLRRSPKTWSAPRDPIAARDTVLENFISRREYYEPLVSALASTPLADLCDFAGRERLWGNTSIGPQYLETTAQGWLKRASEAGVPFAPDQRISRAVLANDRVDKALAQLIDDITKGIRIVEAIQDFDETRFISWLRLIIAKSAQLSIGTAEAVGRLVLAKRWQRAVDELVSGYHKRLDLKPALRICASMIGFFTKWGLNLSTPTADEKWDSLVAVAAELYSSGPDHHELWARAGGKNADLPRHGIGRSRWKTVLEQVRHGCDPSPSRLLQEMLRDYAGNEELSIFARDPDIISRRR